MNPAGQFRREYRVDGAMPVDSALAAEGFRYDMNPVMRFPARTVPGMARMKMGLIFDAKARRRESFRQFLCDDIFGLHGGSPVSRSIRLKPGQSRKCQVLNLSTQSSHTLTS
jgi:hypothetical protein